MHLQFRFYSTTIIIFLLISSLIAIFFGWINAQETIFSFFHFLSLQQKNLFLWLNFSNVQFSITLFLPLIISILVIQFTLILSPKQKKWSRIIIIFTSLFLMIRYFLWRWQSTLNLTNPVNTIFSIGIFLIELAFIISPFWQSILMLNIKNRKSQADTMSEAVKQGIYYPTVDILIPSYNEPLEVIKRTIVGCQAIEYNYKKIYLLDDGNREEIRQLCEQLKCYYISRENSIHAKAGNLNHALSQTNGELIVVFDADF
ncbi:MAG: glycosyltransferase, partial [Cyanobacteria bacterium]|nr:glycosyltransferase [Cyanobacteria bacterium CG_2015-04_32_10]